MIGESFDVVLAAARAGAPWAFERIYHDLAPSVIGYVRAHGAGEPEDVAQEVFVGVVRTLDRFQGDEAAFRSWVFTIAHRRLLDERRRRGRRPEDLLAPQDVADAAPGRGDAEDEALDRLSHAECLELLHGLTDDQREVIVLRVLADLSVAQVADVMGKNEGAVKTLTRRALARLAREVAAEGVS